MKMILSKILFLVIVAFGLTGCYTIVWSPDSEFPTQENSDNSTIYYGDNYYGDYYYFYDSPWWYDYAPPVSSRPITGSRDENQNIETPRNNDGRGTPTRDIDLRPPAKVTTPPENKDNGNTNKSGDSSGSAVRNSSSDSNSGSTNSRQNTSGNSNPVRNNDGGRNSNSGRK